jgi:putrescine aminotransferase
VTEHSPPPPAADELRENDSRYVLRPWSGEPPVVVVSAQGCTVTDASGTEYLDLTAGYFVNQAGHCHPRVVEAATRQLGQVMQVSGKQATPVSIALAERLVQITPRPLAKSFFATGGSEATEFALRMARQHTGKEDVAYLDNAYHGLTLGALEVCASDKYRASGAVTLADRTYKLPTPYCYRCEYQGDCATQCLDEAEKRLDQRPATAALIAEPIQAVGGVIPPEKWWARADQIRKKRGLLLILDEIQTGLGRTGELFAYQAEGFVPDILVLAKSLSGGVAPIGATLTSAAIHHRAFGRMDRCDMQFSTFGGNTFSCVAALETLDIIEDQRLVANSRERGREIIDGLRARLHDHPLVRDIRGRGLLIAIELGASGPGSTWRQRLLPALARPAQSVLGQWITVKLLERQIICQSSTQRWNVVKLMPPLTIDADSARVLVEGVAAVLGEYRSMSAVLKDAAGRLGEQFLAGWAL